ncbi:DnaT-like ssDNA-binding protein [Mesorhizobium sp. ASY16-5R]|uniref:DnaT-like ssDNA-binding protein n=1 Tax=Mesorhizobium sp. ASY16-5R TaxID=3445772 RepID=UPI003FA00E59
MDVGTDAYVSVTEVNDYLTARGQVTAWAAASNPAKEAAIIEATSFLDAAFSWVGKLEDTDQSLGWPRVCATDREGRTLSDIPTPVKNACSELANLALGGRLMPMSLSTGSAAVKRDKIGDTETEYDTTRFEGSYEYVRMILRGIGSLSGTGIGMSKLVRT